MKLLIDAGNTRIKFALTDGEDDLLAAYLPNDQAGELARHFASHFGRRRAGFSSVQQVWVSNVAGEAVAQHIRAACAAHCWQPHFITAQEVQCGVRNGYAMSRQLGSDRWAALIAAWHQMHAACLVVNCGTATTVDALSARGEFLGGLILPGVELMQRNLTTETAQLPPSSGEYANFPCNTADAIFSGAIQASCGAVDRQYALLEDASAQVLLSGGATEWLRPQLNLPLRMADNLVLQGLLLIAQEVSES